MTIGFISEEEDEDTARSEELATCVITVDSGEVDPHVIESFEFPFCGYPYVVEYRDDVYIKEEAGGYCDPQNSVIAIDTHNTDLMRREVLIHELIEAANIHCGLEMHHIAITTLASLLSHAMSNRKFREKMTV
jgi:hypothetical protein